MSNVYFSSAFVAVREDGVEAAFNLIALCLLRFVRIALGFLCYVRIITNIFLLCVVRENSAVLSAGVATAKDSVGGDGNAGVFVRFWPASEAVRVCRL